MSGMAFATHLHCQYGLYEGVYVGWRHRPPRFRTPNAIENELEMDEKLAHVVAKLNRSSVYPAMFKNVFGYRYHYGSPYAQGFVAIPADVGFQSFKSTIKSDREKINSQPMSQRDMRF